MGKPIVIRLSWMCSLAVLVAGCASWLPESHSVSPTFKTFDEARQVIETVVPLKTDVAALASMGIDPIKQPNTNILTPADILKRVVNGSAIGKDDLDPGIVTCITARDACRGWELNVANISKVRTGNFWADFFNFKRHSNTTGWRFNALILLVNGVVVYRAWGGQPVVNEIEDTRNPLGPFQDIGPAVANTTR